MSEQEAITSAIASGGLMWNNAVFAIFQAIMGIIIAIVNIVIAIADIIIGFFTMSKGFLMIIRLLLINTQKKREEDHRI
jgi:hypothetical protein